MYKPIRPPLKDEKRFKGLVVQIDDLTKKLKECEEGQTEVSLFLPQIPTRQAMPVIFLERTYDVVGLNEEGDVMCACSARVKNLGQTVLEKVDHQCFGFVGQEWRESAVEAYGDGGTKLQVDLVKEVSSPTRYYFQIGIPPTQPNNEIAYKYCWRWKKAMPLDGAIDWKFDSVNPSRTLAFIVTTPAGYPLKHIDVGTTPLSERYKGQRAFASSYLTCYKIENIHRILWLLRNVSAGHQFWLTGIRSPKA